MRCWNSALYTYPSVFNNPSCQRLKAGWQPGQVASLSQSHIETNNLSHSAGQLRVSNWPHICTLWPSGCKAGLLATTPPCCLLPYKNSLTRPHWPVVLNMHQVTTWKQPNVDWIRAPPGGGFESADCISARRGNRMWSVFKLGPLSPLTLYTHLVHFMVLGV